MRRPKVAEAAVDGGGLLGWLSRGGPLQWFGKAGATGISWLGGLSAGTLIEGLQSGNKGIQDILRRAHPEWTDQQMKDWVKAVQAGNNPDEAQPPPAPEQLHDRPPLTPAPDHFIDDLNAAGRSEIIQHRPRSALRHPESRGWSLFNPRTWFGAKAAPSGDSWTDKANQIPTDLPHLTPTSQRATPRQKRRKSAAVASVFLAQINP